MALKVWILCNIIAFSHSFLFDVTTNKPSTMTINKNHYNDLLQMIMQEHSARVQLQDVVDEQKLEIIQHRTALLELNSRLERLEGTTAPTSSTVQLNSFRELEQKYQLLSQEHRNLTQIYSSLYQEHQILATKFLTEKNKTATLAKYVFDIVSVKLLAAANQTKALEKDFAVMKQVQAVGQLQAIADLQNVTSKIKTDVNMLLSNSQARLQDIVALNHAILKNGNDIDAIKTTNANNISGLQQEIDSLNSKSQSTSQDLVSLFNQLTATAKEMKLLGETTVANISRIYIEMDSITQNLNRSLNHVQRDLVALQNPVGFTAFGTSQGTLNADTIIKFTDIATSFGLTSLSSLRSTGTFRAEKEGVYLVITSIMVDASNYNTWLSSQHKLWYIRGIKKHHVPYTYHHQIPGRYM